MATPRKLSDLEKARLFLRALNSFTMAEAALRHRDKLKSPLRSLVDRLISNWEKTETQARSVSTEDASAILREFVERLDRRMVQGEKDMTERFSARQRTGPLLLAWGLLYLFRTRAQDLAEELTPARSAPVADGDDSKETPAAQGPPDVAALQDFQMALGLGP